MEGALYLFHPPSCSSNLNHSIKSHYPLLNPTFLIIHSKSFNKTHKSSTRISSQSPEKIPVPERSRRKTRHLNLEVSPHRAVAAVRLLRIEQGGAFADLLIAKGRNSAWNEMEYVERTLGFRTRDLDDRDIRLVTDVVGGTVRWRRYLDHLIMSLCNEERTFRDMEPLLLQILRIGFYEIIKLGMPSYAVVDENVRLAKAALRPGAGNLVNGILRKLVLLKETYALPLPKVEGDERAQARVLATIHSHPVVPHELSTYTDDFVRIQTGMQTVIQAGLLKEGLCSVQDESAGLVVSVLDPQPGETIIDCCAAPGGKTLFMASRMRGQGKVLAIDINKGRLRILKETAKLHNLDGIITTCHADLRLFAEKNILKSDKVLLDTPCTGLGVLSKRSDLRWNRRLEDLEQLKLLQDELLDAASKLVKPAGLLVYSTCSIDPEENEERIASFLLRHPEFVLDHLHGHVPPNFITEKGFYFSNPVKHSIDGSFAARLIRLSHRPA